MLVREVVITGVIGRWFYNRGWRGVTLPDLRGGIKIRYWWDGQPEYPGFDALELIDPEVKAHEHLIHVQQIRVLGRFRYLRLYVKHWLDSYHVGRKYMELSRREAAQFAYDVHPMEQDDWRENV